MNDKQKKFAEEYIKDMNGTQSAIRAGYSAKTAEVQASTLLRNPKVSAYLQTLKAQSSEKYGIDVQRLVDELKMIAFGDIRDVVSLDGDSMTIKLKGEKSRLIQEIKIKEGRVGTEKGVKLHSKLDAIEKLLKITGDYAPEKKQIEGSLEVFSWNVSSVVEKKD